MNASRGAAIAAVASVALVASAVAGFAQSAAPPGGRVIEVPPGAVVLVLPAGAVPVAAAPPGLGLPFPAMPAPAAMFQEMDRMMADMQRAFAPPAWLSPDRAIEAAARGRPLPGGPIAGVVVTSISNGHGTCTQRIVYGGNGAAPQVQTVSTGDACAAAGLRGAIPAAEPGTRWPAASPQHLIEVKASQPVKPAPRLIETRERSGTVPLVLAEAGG